MAIDPAIERAIAKVMDRDDLPDALGRRLVAWLEDLYSGAESLDDLDSSLDRVKLLFDAFADEDVE